MCLLILHYCSFCDVFHCYFSCCIPPHRSGNSCYRWDTQLHGHSSTAQQTAGKLKEDTVSQTFKYSCLPKTYLKQTQQMQSQTLHCWCTSAWEKSPLLYISVNTLKNYGHHYLSCREEGFGLIRVTSVFDTCKLWLPKIYGSGFICLQSLTS